MAARINIERTSPQVVVIGGGTGLSTMLRGLKRFTPNITAIVTVADDGGGSGILRRELGVLPPGDIRNCIRALANTEPEMEALLDYRFNKGRLKGQCFGNLFLAALCGISDSFDEAVAKMSEVLAITGRVLPVTNEDVRLEAEFENGSKVLGESKIALMKKEGALRIKRVRLIPERPAALKKSIDAIKQAEMIVLGPGSLYTSIIPNLLVDGISEAIVESNALRVYVCNIMTQPGETDGYTASDHISALFRHSNGNLLDICLINSAPIPENLLERYAKEGAVPTEIDRENIDGLGVELCMAPLAMANGEFARHNTAALASELMRLYKDKSPTRLYEI